MKNFENNKICDIVHNSAFKNGLWLYILQIFNMVIPIFTLPYVTRILGVYQYGVFSIGLNFIGYLQVLVDYGFNMSATRFVILNKNDKNKLNDCFTGVLYSRFFLVGIGLLLLLCYVVFVDSTNRVGMLVLFLYVLGTALQIDWFYQGMMEMKYILFINVIARSFFLVGVFELVKGQHDLLIYCFLYGFTPVSSGIIGIMWAKKKYKISLNKFSILSVKIHLMDGWYVFTTQLSSTIFGAIGVTFLGMFSEPCVVGGFSAIQKIPLVILMLWSPISRVLYPLSSKKFHTSFLDGMKFIKMIMYKIILVFVLVVLFLSLFSRNVIEISFGQDYVEYYYWIFPLMFWVLVAIFNNFLGIQILLGSGYDKEYSACFQKSVIATVVLNFAFIYLWEGTGAAMAPLMSEIFLTVLLLRTVKVISGKYNT